MRRLAPDWAWPARLVRFDPAEWPAGPCWQRWQQWLHARADFADWNGIDADDIPDETARDVLALMQASLWNPSPTLSTGVYANPTHPLADGKPTHIYNTGTSRCPG